MMQTDHFPLELTIIDINIETPDTKTFYLSSPVPLTYEAGQYISFLADPLDYTSARSYSFSSSPYESHISITVKRQDNGLFSRWLIDKAMVGNKLTAISISGKFILPKNRDKQSYVFFAAGSGIVPIFSIIKTLLHHEAAASILLIYSNRHVSSTIFYDALLTLVSLDAEVFKMINFFSDAPNILDARLSAFQVPSLVHANTDLPIEDIHFYLCGPIDYMDTVRMTLLTHGADKSKVHTEEYFFYTETLEESLIPPPDTNAYPVTIEDKGITIEVQYPQSILHTALAQHIHLPYSCSSGQCGSCVARIKSGKVWMSYNSVLTAEEIKAGYTLTCQGFPIEGHVTISYSDI